MHERLKHNQIKSNLHYTRLIPFGCHELAVPISAALRQSPHIKIAAVASRWQRLGDLVGSGIEPHMFRTRGRRLLAPSGRLKHNHNVLFTLYCMKIINIIRKSKFTTLRMYCTMTFISIPSSKTLCKNAEYSCSAVFVRTFARTLPNWTRTFVNRHSALESYYKIKLEMKSNSSEILPANCKFFLCLYLSFFALKVRLKSLKLEFFQFKLE